MIEEDIFDLIDKIETREDFEKFLSIYVKEFKSNSVEWDNKNLEDYLNGMYDFTLSMQGYFNNIHKGIDSNKASWRVFAEILMAARVYG